ncbi:MAG: Transcription elongation factor GreB [Steroidobacteraceae bacterium]|nr:Transcription elongation factor GreB [Steroidobacteraceae bacterium]
MSRAFVREGDGQVELPERAISPHPNLVTPAGLAQIEANVRALERARCAARESSRDAATGVHDAAALATIERDLRYWMSRKSSARLIVPAAMPDAVRFGVQVVLHALDGSSRPAKKLRIVGEDEADPAQGLLSYVSPAAEKLIGARLGDEVDFGGVTYEVGALAPAEPPVSR